ncbi:ABC transporter ATP-binding protein [Cereibacter sphaeroides]|nr:ABC transporter ATP-binding protein [Cereibacter sphaeroides]
MMVERAMAAEAALGTPEGPDHLVLSEVGMTFGTLDVIPSLSLSVRRGEMVAFLGPSGCGKTTTLRMIAGLLDPTRGRISVGGRDITHLPVHDRDMGMVFQSYALFPHMTVAQNVAFGLEMRRMAKAEIRTRVERSLAMVQLGHLAGRKPKALSGGQQQRVALARALVVEPSILLLDEPLSNLDAKLRDEMRVQIRSLQQQSGITAVFVTHDQVEALSMCDRIVVMRGGHVEQYGTPNEIYERPATPFVASFVGRTNRLSGRVDPSGRLLIEGRPVAAEGRLPEGAVEVLVRPHRMSLCAASEEPSAGLNSLPGVLTGATFVGDLIQATVRVGAGEITVEQLTRRRSGLPEPGSAVTVAWEAGDTMVYPEGKA